MWRVAIVTTAILAGLVASGAFVWQGSRAAFTKQANNTGNVFSAAGITLSEDGGGSARFSAANLIPGTTYRKCIVVTYSSAVQSDVKMFVSGYSGTNLGQYLNLTVEEGAGSGTSATNDCTDGAVFTVAGAALYTGTLSDGAGTGAFTGINSWATAVGAWQPTGNNQNRLYRLTYSLANDDNAQGLNCTVAFRWEARSI